MGDAGEGLVDAESRAAERMAEREEARQRSGRVQVPIDAGRERTLRSLQLARTELIRQQQETQNERRREQLGQALSDIEQKLAGLQRGE